MMPVIKVASERQGTQEQEEEEKARTATHPTGVTERSRGPILME
jgi:hypothetical protein